MRSVFLKDLRERVIMTFVQGVLGSLVVTELADKGMWLAAVGGGVAAVAALLKGLVAKTVGNRDSASLADSV